MVVGQTSGGFMNLHDWAGRLGRFSIGTSPSGLCQITLPGLSSRVSVGVDVTIDGAIRKALAVRDGKGLPPSGTWRDGVPHIGSVG